MGLSMAFVEKEIVVVELDSVDGVFALQVREHGRSTLGSFRFLASVVERDDSAEFAAIRTADAGVVHGRTAAQEGWDKLVNGELLKAAEAAGFDLFLTPDKNIRYQQNIAGRKIAIVVLGYAQWPQLKPHVQLVVEAVRAASPGTYIEVDIPWRNK